MVWGDGGGKNLVDARTRFGFRAPSLMGSDEVI
jgi:hypothetical protein